MCWIHEKGPSVPSEYVLMPQTVVAGSNE